MTAKTSMLQSLFRPAFALAVALALTACGGGSSGGGSVVISPPGDGGGVVTPPPGGGGGDPDIGIDRGGLLYAEITAFGSVVVKGVRYDTANATITVNGLPASQSALNVGDVVLLSGTVNDDGVTGVAEQIIADDVLEGVVDSIDLAAGQFKLLEQTVIVTADTIFGDGFALRTLEGLSPGDAVEVAGFIGDGHTIATRVERDTDDDGFEVVGYVSNLDSGARTFNINGLLVDYSAASLDDFPGDAISEGDLVEAEGTVFDSGTLFANDVDFWGNRPRLACDDFAGDDDNGECEVEIEGYVSAVNSATSFELNGVPVLVTAETTFEGGTAADIALNLRLEVDGFVNAEGALVAEEIDFEDEDRPVEIEALVQAIDLDNGLVTLLGIDVQFTSKTRFEDFSLAQALPFRPEDIRVGDYLNVIGVPAETAGSDVVATKIEREDDDDNDASLQGFVESLAQPDLVILGVTVQTTATTEFELRNADGVSQADFFGAIKVGELVDVDGIQVSDMVILADKAEQEDDAIDD